MPCSAGWWRGGRGERRAVALRWAAREARSEEVGLLAQITGSNGSISLILLFISSQCCTDLFFFLHLRQAIVLNLKRKTKHAENKIWLESIRKVWTVAVSGAGNP